MRSFLCVPAALALACGGLDAAPARAFSDFDSFDFPETEGGGGGRYFTGAPWDGYTCEVCHVSDQRSGLKVRGLPTEGYLPGSAYQVEVAWPAHEAPYAVHVEVAAGSGIEIEPFTLSDATLAPPAERCNQSIDGRLAASVKRREGRRILYAEGCGASVVRFTLTTPDEANLFFSLAAVSSNDDLSPAGDMVASQQRVLRRAAGGASGCAASNTGHSAASPWLVALSLLALLWRRTRRHCSAIPNDAVTSRASTLSSPTKSR